MRYAFILGFVLGLVRVGFCVTLDGLINRFALKESSFVKKVEDITLLLFTKTISEFGEDSTYQLVMRKGERFRVEKDDPEEPIIIGKGDDVWTIFPSENRWTTFFTDRFHYPSLAQWSKLIPKESKIKETQKLYDRSAYKIEIPEKWKWTSPFSVIYVDMGSPLVLRVRKWDMSLINYSDFREIVPDIFIPFRIEIFQKNFLSKSEVKLIEMNKDLPDNWFDPKKEDIKSRISEIISRSKER